MTQCLNPDCLESNPPETKFCQSCDEKLLLVERYRALKIIGRGGFGRTFQAVDEFKPSKPFCVIKQFLPQAQGTENLSKAALLFAQEAERLDTLGRHPQIPELLAYFSQDNRQYLVQEFIDGQTLQQELAWSGAFDERKILELLKSLLPVLEFIHSQQVIHRDIKPENIIRRKRDNQLVLVDFGIAKFVTKIAVSGKGTIIGSEGYAPPEQAIGKATFSSDIYSLGVTCIHLLTEVEPVNLFDVGEDKWIWRDYLKSKVSDQVKNLLDKMIIRATKKRFQNPREILSLINQIYPTEKPLTPPPQTEKLIEPSVINQTFPPPTFLTPIPESEIGEIFTFEVVTINNFGKIISHTTNSARQKIEDLGNDIKLEMVYIPGGNFIMGSPEDKRRKYDIESPPHQVTIQPFYMSKYPITQNQYQTIMGENPSNFKGGNFPVENVTWHNATEFCQRLSEKTGKIYRLPSESQWEYACRAGTTTPFYFGETITSELANYNSNYTYGKVPKTNYRQETTNVGIFPPNAFGLYDMHGNVWEWCLDIWHDNYNGAPNDGSVWEKGESINQRVIRGGSWNDNPNHCRSAFRFNNYFDNCIINLGFRVLLLPNFQKKSQNTGAILSVINQTYSTEKKFTPPPQISQKLTVPPVINETSPPQKFITSISESEKGEIFTFDVVTVNNFGKIITHTPGSARQKIEDLGNGIKLEMVYIPGGSFIMGSPENEERRFNTESPQHQVNIQPFYMSKYPITQEQYQVIMDKNPSYFKGRNRPVETVTWYNATEFSQQLSEKTRKIYSLPSESQWEYACRAGTTTPFYFGETITSEFANYNGNSTYRDAPKGKYQQQTTNVGSFPPNAFGLYDMHGNVWEWCLDIWHDNYEGAPNDGSPWQDRDIDSSPLRGGSWYDNPEFCRSAIRVSYFGRVFRYNYFGFRIVCSPDHFL